MARFLQRLPLLAEEGLDGGKSRRHPGPCHHAISMVDPGPSGLFSVRRLLIIGHIFAIGGFLIALPVEVNHQVEKILIGNGTELTIQESPHHRGVPHFYYDQAMEAIKDLCPESEVLVARRFGTLGEAVYSLVCYKESKGQARLWFEAYFLSALDPGVLTAWRPWQGSLIHTY